MRDLYAQLYGDRHWIESSVWTHEELMDQEAALDGQHDELTNRAWLAELGARKFFFREKLLEDMKKRNK